MCVYIGIYEATNKTATEKRNTINFKVSKGYIERFERRMRKGGII